LSGSKLNRDPREFGDAVCLFLFVFFDFFGIAKEKFRIVGFGDGAGEETGE